MYINIPSNSSVIANRAGAIAFSRNIVSNYLHTGLHFSIQLLNLQRRCRYSYLDSI